ncbi:MAG: radical SAM protein [Planctomycetota bacterium]
MYGSFGISPSQASLMIKPVGPACNLRCAYCYYLSVADGLYDGRTPRMGTDTLEAIFAAWLPRGEQTVTISWQGGEPTLAGLPFFQWAVELQQKHARPGQNIANALQTNGTTLNDDWCRFFATHGFLIGISIDGDADDHDHYRVDPKQQGTFARVQHGLRKLREHGVEHNVLCVLNDRNIRSPRRLYRRVRDLAGSRQRGPCWLQFIPGIEWVDPPEDQPNAQPTLASFSPDGEAYGRFLCEVFDQWFEHDRLDVSIRIFDNVLSVLTGGPPVECTHGPACHSQVTVEHNGDLFGCDHYVQRRWQLGTVHPERSACGSAAPAGGSLIPVTVGDTDARASVAATSDADWLDRLDHVRLRTFADRKLHLPATCRACDYRKFCHGGCPKHRPHRGDTPEASTLCAGYRRFFAHSMERFEWLAGFLQRGQMPPAPGREIQGQRRPDARRSSTTAKRRPTRKRRRR